MNIRILQLIEGARKAKGLAVIIDVFRAFSTACYVFDNGARHIIPVGDVDTARELKKQNPTYFLIGERSGERLSDFDYGNSPTEIKHVDFTGSTVIQTTSAGTQGIVNAWQAKEIITGSFCNVGAVLAYIQSKEPRQVSLVCMGHAALEPADEDTLCAQFIKDSLEGKTTDFQQIRAHLRGYRSAHKFFNPKLTWAPRQDFDLCLDLARFGFVLRSDLGKDGHCVLKKVDVSARSGLANPDHVRWTGKSNGSRYGFKNIINNHLDFNFLAQAQTQGY